MIKIILTYNNITYQRSWVSVISDSWPANKAVASIILASTSSTVCLVTCELIFIAQHGYLKKLDKYIL